jgi:hypothetical protein
LSVPTVINYEALNSSFPRVRGKAGMGACLPCIRIVTPTLALPPTLALLRFKCSLVPRKQGRECSFFSSCHWALTHYLAAGSVE